MCPSSSSGMVAIPGFYEMPRHSARRFEVADLASSGIPLPLVSEPWLACAGGCNALELRFQKRRIEAKWSRLRLERYAAAAIDQVDAVGPSGVGALGRVAHVVDQRGNLDAQLPDPAGRDARSFLETPRQPENDALPDVTGHLPHVAGMGFLDVDHEEGD